MFTALIVAESAFAATPSTIGYQGRLRNSSGTAQTGSFSVTFRMYGALSGGSAIWSETQTLTVTDGFLSAQLGSVTPFPATMDFNQPLYFSVEVNSDGEMSPRVPVNTIPYAYTAGGINSLDAVPGSATGGRMYYNTTNGSLNYYDGVNGVWRNLRQPPTSTLQTVTDGGGRAGAIWLRGCGRCAADHGAVAE